MAVVINGNGTVTGIAVGGLPDGIVDNGTMADDAIAIADLAATGTASSSTFLRGDNSWQEAGGGAWSVKQSGGVATNIASFEYTAVGTKDMWIRMNGLTSVGSAQQLYMYVSQSSSFVTTGTGYNSSLVYWEANDAVIETQSGGNAYMKLTTNARVPATGGDSVRAFSVDIQIFNGGGTTKHTSIYTQTFQTADARGTRDQVMHSFDTNTSAIDGFKLYGASANINYDNYVIMELN